MSERHDNVENTYFGGNMRKPALAIALSAVLFVTGCGATEQSSETVSQSASQSAAPNEASNVATEPAQETVSTPSETPSPVAMTVEEAGEFYLLHVCASNRASGQLNDASKTVPFNLERAKAEAATTRDAYRKVIEKFSAKETRWPTQVKNDVAEFVDALYGEVATTGHLAEAQDEAGFTITWNGWTDPAAQSSLGAVSQKIRAKLNLPADARGSCKALAK